MRAPQAVEEVYDISGHTFTDRELREKFCFSVQEQKSLNPCERCRQKCQTILDLYDNITM